MLACTRSWDSKLKDLGLLHTSLLRYHEHYILLTLLYSQKHIMRVIIIFAVTFVRILADWSLLEGIAPQVMDRLYPGFFLKSMAMHSELG